MDNTVQNLSIDVGPAAVDPAASGEDDKDKLTPLESIKTIKEMDKELTEDCPHMNGVADDSVRDYLSVPSQCVPTYGAEMVTSECNGTDSDQAQSQAESVKENTVKGASESDTHEKQSTCKVNVEEMRDKLLNGDETADISDDDIIIEDTSNDMEISDEDIISTDIKSNSNTDDLEISLGQEIQNDLENPLDPNVSGVQPDLDLICETNELLMEKVVENDSNEINVAINADCDTCKDKEKIVCSQEPNIKSNMESGESDKLDNVIDATSESMEYISEGECSAEDNNASTNIQNSTSESEGPLLLELSHDSEASGPKIAQEKVKDPVVVERQITEGKGIKKELPQTDSLETNLEKDVKCSELKEEKPVHHKAGDVSNEELLGKPDSNDLQIEPEKTVKDSEKAEIEKDIKEKSDIDTETSFKVETTLDTSDAMEISDSSEFKPEIQVQEESVATKDVSIMEASQSTDTIDTTLQNSSLVNHTMEVNQNKTETTENDIKNINTNNTSNETDAHLEQKQMSDHNSDVNKMDSKVAESISPKGKKLDQLLSKITIKAESDRAKSNENIVPKQAKARKSFSSASNSMKSSSSSISLPISSSLTSLTFNVKELEKRGVLDKPKPQKRKAFDPVKKEPVEQKDQSTSVIDILPSVKAPKVKSPVKSPSKIEIPFFTKGKILKGRRRKGKRSGRYRLPGEKINKKSTNARKKDSEERQLSDVDMHDKVPSAMSVTDKVRKAQALEHRNEVVGAVEVKNEDYARNAFNESLGLSRKIQHPVTKVSESGISTHKQNALDIMTKNSKLSFSTTPSSTKKAKKSVRHGIDSSTHRTLDSFLKGASYSQMNSSLKLASDQRSGNKHEESQNSGCGDLRKRKATESPSNLPFSRVTGSPGVSQEEKKRKVEGITSPRQTQVITLVPTGSPPLPMHSVISSSGNGAGHPIILSPGTSSGTQTLIQNGTINGLPMFQIVNSSMASSQPPQLLAITQNQGSTPRTTALLQPKGMPVLLAPVQMTPIMTTVACSRQSKTQSSSVNSLSNSVLGNQVTSAGNRIPQSSPSQSLLKGLMSPQHKSYIPNGQLLEVKQMSRSGSFPNGLYPVTPPKTPEEQLSETNSQDSVEVSPGGVVPPDKDVIPLCTCKISGASFQKMTTAVTYCQSLDSVDGKVMGCCNKVTNLQLVRPAVKIPFLAVCEGHRKRLRAHQCCPGCGHYCTQGRFLQCKKEGGNSHHLFHEQCQVTKDGKNFCPHCGETSAQFEVQLTMQEHKPSVIKDNKPARSQNKARIQMNEKKSSGSGDESGDESGSGGEKSKKLPTSSEITIGPDRYSLERFIHSLEGERPKKYRHLPKCLYTPAYDNDLERVVYMLEDKHNPNEKYDDLEGQGALHAAAIVGSLPLVHILVQAGASVHLQDKTLRTPLMYAAENSHAEVVSYLMRAGAIINAKADDGMTALHYAAKMGHVTILKQLLDTELVKVDITDDGGWTPLIWAVEHKELEAVKLLLKRNADPNLRDSEENTTLHWAAFAGSVAVAELLLSAGCDLDSLNMHGDRPLHIAARQDHYECIVLFLARGADVEAKNNKGETPLECCLEQSSAVYLALRVNKQLKGFGAKHMGRPEKLLHRDLSKGRENIPIPCVNQVDDDGIPQDYLYVTDNIETTNLKINRVIGSLQSCQCKDDCSSIYCACGKNSVRCWYDKFGRLVSEFNMLEPPLIFECNRACECWTTCNNRVVQNGVMSRLQVFKTEGRGWGCRTLVDIPRGTFICEYIGEHISDSEADRREDDSYLFDLDNRDGETYCIDARRYGNIARFINHLCEPNLVPVKVFVDSQDLRFPRICLFASRDITAMEELGFDYGEKFWIIKWKQFTCTCGSAKCRYSQETIQKTLEEYRLRHEEETEVVTE